MPRTKLTLPGNFNFTTFIPIRITDLNYGNHVGNDSVLSLLHEARVQFLIHHGYTELNVDGVGLIMSDATLEFRNEILYGDKLRASIAATEFSRVGFELYYKLEKLVVQESGSVEKWVPAVFARTSMVCFNYELKKIGRAHV